MGEAAYKRLVGPINPKKPNQSLSMQIKMLKYVGMWAPETDNQIVKFLYNIHTFTYRGIFLYLYSLTQVLFFITVTDLNEVADALFLLMTQICLLYKVEKFYSNRHRIRAIVKRLNSDLFCPMNAEEDEAVKVAMVDSVLCCLAFLIPAILTIGTWAVAPFLSGGEIELPIKAWYPFNTKPWTIYVVMFVVQIYGISQSATFNISTDTIGSALLGHAKSQVERLGIMLSNIGHRSDQASNKNGNAQDSKYLRKRGTVVREFLDKNYKRIIEVKDMDAEMVAINTKVKQAKMRLGEDYGDLVRCIIFHENILQFVAELQDIFKGPIFCQFMFSSLIICMTLLLIVSQTSPAEIFGTMLYLVAMVAQIAISCWTGNEIIYMSYRLTEKAYFSNFINFNKPTARAMMIFMKRSVKDIHVKAGGVFQVTLSIPTLMAIIKSSYSYFAVLQTMQDK